MGYCVARKKPNDTDVKRHLREVNFLCPLCKKDLQPNGQKKRNKLYEIAHIYPNSPTPQQQKELINVEKLGKNSESFENKIALCKDCHSTQDYNTTKEDYQKLLKIKKDCLNESAIRDILNQEILEQYIVNIVDKLTKLTDDEIDSVIDLNYDVVKIDKKFELNESSRLKRKIKNNFREYYIFIQNEFKNKDKGKFEIIGTKIKLLYLKVKEKQDNKEKIFYALVEWLDEKSFSVSRDACEIVISYFVQSCEVFESVTK